MNKTIIYALAGVVLVLSSATQTYYFNRQINDVRLQNKACTKEIGGVREAVRQLGSRFENTDISTIEALMGVVDVYDKNVEVYNRQIQELYKRDDIINEKVDSVINYLSR